MTTNNLLLPELDAWARQHIALDPARVSSMFGFTEAAIGRDKDITKAMFFKSSLWFFGADDIYDAGDLNAAQLQGLTDLLCRNRPLSPELLLSPAKTTIFNDLRHILDELLAAPADKQFQAYLTGLLIESVTAMHQEAAIKLYGAPQDLHSYLETGRRSVGSSFVYAATYYTIDPQCFEGERYGTADRLLICAALVIRLLNDKATYAREVRENKLNSLSIIQRQLAAADGFAEAVRQVDDMIAAQLRQITQLAHSSQDEVIGRFGEFIVRNLEVVRQFYAVRDFK